ncbi:MAG: histidine kinase [Flavobacteriales bacterium]|nr:histidine kinase [Flavobacteriales bacterium]
MALENKVQNSAEYLEFLIKNAPYGIIYLDEELSVNSVNSYAVTYLEKLFSDESLIGKKATKIFANIHELFNELLKVKKKGKSYFDLISVAIEDMYFHVTGQQVADGFVIILRDITEQKIEEKEAMISMLEGQEAERKRLAKEIHDGVGPLISSLKIRIQNLEEQLQTNPTLAAEFLSLYEDFDTLSADIRGLSHSLMPRILTDFGIEEAIKSYLNYFKSKFQVNFHSFLDKGQRFHNQIELALYRIVQESLQNIRKHADADIASIQLRSEDEKVVLTIEDDGKGFNLDDMEMHDLGIGIINMRTRTEALNGYFEISSSLNRGTIIIAEIPLENESL